MAAVTRREHKSMKGLVFKTSIISVLSMLCACDSRKSGDFLPFYGAANGATIAKFPVTNSEYDAFVRTTKHTPPRYWKDNSFPKGKGRHPVLWVSFNDASAYCEWLGAKDASHTYRLPTEAEWESAAGDRPHDAQFNFNGVVASHLLNENPSRAVTFIHPKSEYNGKSSPLAEVISISPDGRRVQGWANHRNHTGFIYTDLFTTINEAGGFTTAVDTYSETKSACGALDMWGNCWEWTSTEIIAQNGAERGKKVNAIKGGSWYANRNSCTTSYRGEGRNPNGCYNTVGFRVVKEPRSRNVLK